MLSFTMTKIFVRNLKFVVNSHRWINLSCQNLDNPTSSKAWIQRHIKDPFVKAAHYDGYRARSAYKLIEVNDKFKILRHGLRVVDCGCAPGSWTQVLVEKVGKSGAIVAVDKSHFSPIVGAHCLPNCDFTLPETRERIKEIFGRGEKIDAVLSDMAPNASGSSSHDHAKIIALVYTALQFATNILSPDENSFFLCKVWDGSDTRRFMDDLAVLFTRVDIVKPRSSRTESSECFILARHFVGLHSFS